jgi:hypothetical protein
MISMFASPKSTIRPKKAGWKSHSSFSPMTWRARWKNWEPQNCGLAVGNWNIPSTDSLIHAYLGHRFGLEADGTELKLAWVGKEVEMDATWCYVECPLPSGTKELQVWNRILLERFDDQANIVHFKSAAQTQSLMLDSGRRQGKIRPIAYPKAIPYPTLEYSD